MVADTGFGQGELQMSPLHLAMISATWANGGTMMRPYLVSSVTAPNGDTIWTADPGTWKEPVSGETASDVRDMMINAVENGSITNARVDGYVVGGKTGTAEIGNDTSHSLFIGFIGDPEPRYAVAVVLEEGSGGLNSAVAIGRDMLVAAIQRYPDEVVIMGQERAYVRSQFAHPAVGKPSLIW
jgi:peptidoglycan glycosyltransferase